MQIIKSLLIGVCMSIDVNAQSELPNFDKLWNYSRPADTEIEFRKLLPQAQESGSLDYYLQLLTQLARTQSLQMKFDEAHGLLDQVENKLTAETFVAKVRLYLERGRTYNSAKKQEVALPLFQKAFDLSVERKLDFHAVDAAHMLAIAVPETEAKIKWNTAALKIAELADDQKAKDWAGTLYFNLGWDYFGIKKYEEALAWFEKNKVFVATKNNASAVRVAQWSKARVYRAMDRLEEAVNVQKTLEAELDSIKEKDGYVYEELGELYLLKNMKVEMKTYFALAYAELSRDPELVKFQMQRLERMKKLSEDAQ